MPTGGGAPHLFPTDFDRDVAMVQLYHLDAVTADVFAGWRFAAWFTAIRVLASPHPQARGLR